MRDRERLPKHVSDGNLRVHMTPHLVDAVSLDSVL
jgi:hypothetical protein